MLKKSRLSDDSKRLIAHIRQHGPQGLPALRPLTGEADNDLRKRLRNLCTAGWLEKQEGAEPTWSIRSAAAPLFDQDAAPKKPKKGQAAPPPMGDFPAPRQIDVMNSTYKPRPFTPPRIGSQDYRAIDSRGLRC